MPWCIQWGRTRTKAPILCSMFWLPEGCACAKCAGPLPTVGSGVARVGPNLSRWFNFMVVFESFGQRQQTALALPPAQP